MNSARHRSSRIWALLRTEVLQTSYTCAPGDLSARFWALPPLKSFTSPLFTDQGLPHQIPPRNSEPKLSRAEAGRGLGRSRSLERVPADQGEKKNLVSPFLASFLSLFCTQRCSRDSAGLETHPEAIGTAQKPAVNTKCAWRSADQSGPEEGAETSLGPGCPDKLGWGSRNGNQTKKNKPFPAAGWELARVLELPSSSPPSPDPAPIVCSP